MAAEFKNFKPKRDSVYKFPPEKIKVNPKLNGRTELPDIEWLIESMVSPVGQIHSVEIRIEAGIPVLTAGFSRWRAAMEINKRKLIPGGFLLRCVSARRTEKEGFIANLHENLIRNAPSEIDDINNIRMLESWGRSHEEIAHIYNRKNSKGEPDVKWVRSKLALASLSEEAKTAVKQGRLKPTAAQAIARMSEEEQREAVKGEGKVTAPVADSPKKPSASIRLAVIEEVLESMTCPKAIVSRSARVCLARGGIETTGDLDAFAAVQLVCAKLREVGGFTEPQPPSGPPAADLSPQPDLNTKEVAL